MVDWRSNRGRAGGRAHQADIGTRATSLSPGAEAQVPRTGLYVSPMLFLDEIADRRSMDPVELRLALLKDPEWSAPLSSAHREELSVSSPGTPQQLIFNWPQRDSNPCLSRDRVFARNHRTLRR